MYVISSKMFYQHTIVFLHTYLINLFCIFISLFLMYHNFII